MGKKPNYKGKNPSNVLAGRNLRYFIETIGMSRDELAEKLGIEKDAVNKILNGTNAISGPYNEILLNELNCDLNFIYGGVARSEMLMNEIGMIESVESKRVLRESVFRMMRYLMDVFEFIE